MSIDKLKMEVVEKINQMQSEASVKEILNHLETLNAVNESKKITAQEVFDEA